MKNLVRRRRIIFRNFSDANLLISGVFPHFKTLPKLVPTEIKEEKKNKPYISFDWIVSSNARSERSIGFSLIKTS